MQTKSKIVTCRGHRSLNLAKDFGALCARLSTLYAAVTDYGFTPHQTTLLLSYW